MQLSTFLAAMAALVTVLPTFNASNLEKSLPNDGGQSTFNQSRMRLWPTSTDLQLGPLRGSAILTESFPQMHLEELTGYLIFAIYSDTACTSVMLATADLLNSCIKNDNGGAARRYSKLTATASAYTKTFYSDKGCLTATRTTVTENYSGRCIDLGSMYISSNGVPPSSSALVSSSDYQNSSCLSIADSILFIVVNTCIMGLNTFISVSGSNATIITYSEGPCKGTANSTESVSLGRCDSNGTEWQFIGANLPTLTPTMYTPSASPSVSSAAPTRSPSASPSASSAAPTRSPSASPSVSSAAPTRSPSASPSASPSTAIPTARRKPSKRPTKTRRPTRRPRTKKPSKAPALAPVCGTSLN